MRYILCLLCTCQLSISWCQFDQSLNTARNIASGGQDFLLLSPEALYSNPAALINGEASISGVLNYANRYGTDIRSASAGISWQNDIQGGGLLIGNYGISGFRQNQVSAAFARKLAKDTRLGIQVNYFNLQIEERGSQSNLDLSLGIQHDFSDKISSGFYIVNPFAAATDNQIQGGTGLSVLGHISDALSVYSSLYRDWGGNLDFRPGIQYELMDQIDIIWSFSTEGVAMNFGTDISLSRNWSVFLAYSTHQFLGNTLSFSTAYIFN
jgi:hypothetical protein